MRVSPFPSLQRASELLEVVATKGSQSSYIKTVDELDGFWAAPTVIEKVLIDFEIGAVVLARPALVLPASAHVTTAPSRLKKKSAPAGEYFYLLLPLYRTNAYAQNN